MKRFALFHPSCWKLLLVALFGLGAVTCPAKERRPNILFVITDDESWVTANAYGEGGARTPNFDQLASQGVLFTQAYCSSPSCSPSRASILTGRPFCSLEEGANLLSTLSPKFPVFPQLLAKAGYAIGHTGKGWGPGDIYAAGRTQEPLGPWYMNGKLQDDKRVQEPKIYHVRQDYAANLEAFLDDKAKDQPFFFWVGTTDPHRSYDKALAEGIDRATMRVPPFLPDVPAVREDMAQYQAEVERADSDFGRLLQVLEKRGYADNTLVVYTSDNGMPFPRCKGFLYDYGVRMPMAVRWPGQVAAGGRVESFVSLPDLAPTFLQAAGVEVPEEMLCHSMLSLLRDGDGAAGPAFAQAFVGRERHSSGRLENGQPVGYPMRGIRTKDFLYIRNFKPGRYPATSGPPNVDTDGGMARNFLDAHKDDPAYAKYWQLCFGNRPAEELYDVRTDPYEMTNVAQDARYAEALRDLQGRLSQWMSDVGDPRAGEDGDQFDRYPVFRPGAKK